MSIAGLWPDKMMPMPKSVINTATADKSDTEKIAA
jgi:hypothetical protein